MLWYSNSWCKYLLRTFYQGQFYIKSLVTFFDFYIFYELGSENHSYFQLTELFVMCSMFFLDIHKNIAKRNIGVLDQFDKLEDVPLTLSYVYSEMTNKDSDNYLLIKEWFRFWNCSFPYSHYIKFVKEILVGDVDRIRYTLEIVRRLNWK